MALTRPRCDNWAPANSRKERDLRTFCRSRHLTERPSPSLETSRGSAVSRGGGAAPRGRLEVQKCPFHPEFGLPEPSRVLRTGTP